MKLPTNIAKHFVFGAIFGVALLLGFGASEASGQTYNDRYNQDRYYNDGYNNNNYYGQDRNHKKQEKRDLKHHQRHEREAYGNSRQLKQHQQQEKREVKQHQRYENGNNRRSNRNGNYYPYNY